MKKFSLILLLAAALVFIGCPPTTGPSGKDDNKNPITLELYEAGMESLEILYVFKEGEQTQPWHFWLYENPNDKYSCDDKWDPSDPVKFEQLLPNHEYTLKAEVFDKDYNDYTLTKKFSTLPKAAPLIEGKYYDGTEGNAYAQIKWNEAGSFTKKIELYRSDSADGEFTLIDYKQSSSSMNISFFNDTTIEDKKTYWYKIKSYEDNTESTGEEDKYILIGESNTIEVQTSAFIPDAIAADSITCAKGITSLIFTWTETEGALKYNVRLTDDSIYNPTTLDSKEVTENSVTFTNLQPKTSYRFNITVTTEGGTSSNTSEKFSTSDAEFSISGYDRAVKVEADQTSAVYSFKVPFEDTTGCSVRFSLRKDTEADSELIQDIGELENYKFLRENLSPATCYNSYVYDTNTAGFIHMTVTYKNKDNQDETKDSWLKVDSFYTRNLNPPANLQVTDISKTEATISFDELTEDEKFGKTPTYEIYAYDKDGFMVKGSNNDFIHTSGTSSPLTLQNLIKGTEYVFKATTTYPNATPSAPQESTSIIANTASGIEQKPVVTLTEVDPGNSEWPFKTYIKADWDPLDAAEGVVPQNLVYGLEYRIFEHNRYTRPQKGISPDLSDVTYTGTSSFSTNILVNRGNQYTVRVYAYDKYEPGDIVYSEPVKIQLKYMDDHNMHGALTYTDWFEEYANEDSVKAGDVVEFTNPKVWEKETEIRSNSTAYNAGYIQLFGQVESTKWLFPSHDGYKFVSFKFNFEKAIKAPAANSVTCVPKLILFDRDCFNFQYSTYGYIDGVYFVVPDEDGHIVTQYTDKEEPYIFETFHMPYFQNNKTSTHPSEAGLVVDEAYVFNNSVYMGVSQVTAGDIAFSYYY